jgi:urease accessory protein
MMLTATDPTRTATDRRYFRPTRIDVRLVEGRARATTLAHGDFLAPRPLGTRATHARIALVGISMALLAGDTVALHVNVGPGATLEIIEPTGMVAYDADGERSRWQLHATLGAGANLIWHGAPFVAAQGSNAHRHADFSLGEGARALVKETLVLGRSSEADVQLRNETRVTRDGHELLVEDLDITAANRRLPGILGSAKAMHTLLAAGWRPRGDGNDPRRLDLAGPGALFRTLGEALHQAREPAEPLFTAWRTELLQEH